MAQRLRAEKRLEIESLAFVVMLRAYPL